MCVGISFCCRHVLFFVRGSKNYFTANVKHHILWAKIGTSSHSLRACADGASASPFVCCCHIFEELKLKLTVLQRLLGSLMCKNLPSSEVRQSLQYFKT